MPSQNLGLIAPPTEFQGRLQLIMAQRLVNRVVVNVRRLSNRAHVKVKAAGALGQLVSGVIPPDLEELWQHDARDYLIQLMETSLATKSVPDPAGLRRSMEQGWLEVHLYSSGRGEMAYFPSDVANDGRAFKDSFSWSPIRVPVFRF